MTTTTLSGKVKQLIFANSVNNYGVAVVALDDNNRSFTSIDEDEITMTGSIAHLKKDVSYRFSGKVVQHERYGIQFQVESAEVLIEDLSGYLVTYFSSENFKGIGKKTAMMMVEALGEDAVHRLRENPALLEELPFLNEKKRLAIMEGLQKDELDDTQAFLTSLGLNWRICTIIKMNYPTNTIPLIKENPYRMVPEVSGIGFATADKIGQKLHFQEDHPFRLYAMVYALFSDACFQSGHTYFERSFVEQTLWHRSHLPQEVYLQYVQQLLRDGYLIEDHDDFYLSEQWEAERYIARYLAEFPYVGMPDFDLGEVEACLASVEQTNHIHYDSVQKEAILQFFAEDFMILSGGPGTGKTTIVKGIIDTLKRIGSHYKIGLAAPTGRAAKRLAEVCDVESSTLHSMLKWNLETNTFGKNANDPLEYDVLIVDEFSMVDP
ncbi:MAG: AAA family ATPase, partial [Erysipelotrichaceae bacterium]